MQTIGLTQVFYNEKNEPILNLPVEAPWTLQNALEAAMIETPHRDPGPITADDKLARYALWQKLKAAEFEITISPEDVALLKKAAGALYTPLFYGQLVEMLDGSLKRC